MAVIAIDLGGTKIAAAIFSDEGDKISTNIVSLNKRDGIAVAGLIKDQCLELLQSAAGQKIKISSIGICVPGIYYAKNGNVWAPNIPGWDNFPLLNYLRENITLEKPEIKIDSDRACYILGEIWKGNAKGCSDAIFLAVGTGIGAGILVNNTILRGAEDISGAIGWMALDRPYNKKYSSCGCFEYNASGEGIRKNAETAILDKSYPTSILNSKDLSMLKTTDVFEAFENNDPLATAVLNNAIECWGMAVANLVSLFNPQKIIFGGGVFGPALQFLDLIYAEAKKWAQPISIQQVKLEGSALGSDAGLYGAGYLALYT